MTALTVPQARLPFQPICTAVCCAAELFHGFGPASPGSYAETMDFRSYEWFVRTGRSNPVEPHVAMMRALHESSVTLDAGSVIADCRVVGIMGGHQLPRNSAEHRGVASLGRALADGTPDHRLGRVAQDWFAPAWELSRTVVAPVFSLSIPTRHYGHDPTSPFATHTAKLFQNSIRDDGVLTVARQGIVLTQGSAGTLSARTRPEVKKRFDELVLVTDDVREAADHLDRFEATPSPLAVGGTAAKGPAR